MWQLPPLPEWDGLHPLVIHFPIVLTLISPVFIALALPKWKARWPLAVTGAAMLIVAAVFAWVAVSTGEEAGELAMRTPEMNPVLNTHEELAEFSASWLTGLAIGSVALLGLVAAIRKIRQPLWLFGSLALIVCQGIGVLAVTNTAHNGGRLVHEFGVHALLPAEPSPANGGEPWIANPGGDDDDDDD